MSKRKPAIEVLPSPAEILRAPAQDAELRRLVAQEVAKVLAAKDEFVFEPFFRSRQIAYELRRLQTVPEQRKWTIYYERYGCIHCDTSERIHTGNGFCANCYPKIFGRLKTIIREQINAKPTTIRRLLKG